MQALLSDHWPVVEHRLVVIPHQKPGEKEIEIATGDPEAHDRDNGRAHQRQFHHNPSPREKSRASYKIECPSVFALRRSITCITIHSADLRTVTRQWRNPQHPSKDIRHPTEDMRISSGEPSKKKVRGKNSSASGAKDDHGTRSSLTGTADSTPVCHKTSLTSETEGGERESPACVQRTGRPDRPVSKRDWSPTDVSSVSDNHSPISRPNGQRKTIGG